MTSTVLTLGFSPCPNDTFIFDAMLHGKIDTEGFVFQPFIEDVECLNKKAFDGILDITKLSFSTFAMVTYQYILLNSGSAMGNKCGPLLVSRSSFPVLDYKNKNIKIAVPGKNTTADFLLNLFFPELTNKTEMLFSEIEDAVVNKKADAGVIIHENRFTYMQKGLKKIADLGELWERQTMTPIPLGGIAVKRNLSPAIRKKINRVMKKSVEFAMTNPMSSFQFVSQHAQTMNVDVINKHIALYVNKYTVDLGREGKNAVHRFMQEAIISKLITDFNSSLFCEDIAIHRTKRKK